MHTILEQIREGTDLSARSLILDIAWDFDIARDREGRHKNTLDAIHGNLENQRRYVVQCAQALVKSTTDLETFNAVSAKTFLAAAAPKCGWHGEYCNSEEQKTEHRNIAEVWKKVREWTPPESLADIKAQALNHLEYEMNSAWPENNDMRKPLSSKQRRKKHKNPTHYRYYVNATELYKLQKDALTYRVKKDYDDLLRATTDLTNNEALVEAFLASLPEN